MPVSQLKIKASLSKPTRSRRLVALTSTRKRKVGRAKKLERNLTSPLKTYGPEIRCSYGALIGSLAAAESYTSGWNRSSKLVRDLRACKKVLISLHQRVNSSSASLD